MAPNAAEGIKFSGSDSACRTISVPGHNSILENLTIAGGETTDLDCRAALSQAGGSSRAW